MNVGKNIFIRQLSSEMIYGGAKQQAIELSSIDRFQTSVHAAQVFVFENTLDATQLKKSLSILLSHFPIFSGRLISISKGCFAVDCNDRGVSFSETECLFGLKYFENRNRLSEQAAFLNKSFFPAKVVDQDIPLLAITLTQLKGGGSILGVSNSHCVADLPGMFNFMSAWSAIILNKPFAKPRFDRNLLSKPLSAITQSTESGYERFRLLTLKQHREMAVKLVAASKEAVTGILYYEKEALKQLKQEYLAHSKSSDDWVSSQDILMALVWRDLSKLNNGQGSSKLSTVINYRKRIGFTIPASYVGNTITTRIQEASAELFHNNDIFGLARKIRSSVNTVTPEIIIQDLAYLASVYRDMEMDPVLDFLFEQMDNGLSINNLSGLNIADIDLGVGIPIWYNPPIWPLTRVVHILPSSDRDKGNYVHVKIPRSEMNQLSTL